MWIAILLTAIPFIIWDILAYQRGHWDFNYDFLFGYSILGLPIEEIAFFLLVPYSTLYVWIVVKHFTTFKDLLNKTFTF
jgi:lycopene cyclase domain-containing protein